MSQSDCFDLSSRASSHIASARSSSFRAATAACAWRCRSALRSACASGASTAKSVMAAMVLLAIDHLLDVDLLEDDVAARPRCVVAGFDHLALLGAVWPGDGDFVIARWNIDAQRRLRIRGKLDRALAVSGTDALHLA